MLVVKKKKKVFCYENVLTFNQRHKYLFLEHQPSNVTRPGTLAKPFTLLLELFLNFFLGIFQHGQLFRCAYAVKDWLFELMFYF